MKSIKILIIIIIILGVVLGLKISGKIGNSNSVTNAYTEKELLELAKKGISYNNIYTCYEIAGGQKTEKFLKNNILVVKDEEQYVWQNLETNEVISIKENNVLIQKQSTSLPRFENFPIRKYLEDTNKYKIEYNKNEKFQGKECVVVNAINNETSEILEEIWLDSENGLPVRTTISEKYSYSIGTVTDEDVKKPDLTGYNVIDLDNK